MGKQQDILFRFPPQSAAGALQSTQEVSEEEETEGEESIEYIEPVFERFENLAGVNTATKVFVKDGITIQSSKMKVASSSSKNDEGKKTARTLCRTISPQPEQATILTG